MLAYCLQKHLVFIRFTGFLWIFLLATQQAYVYNLLIISQNIFYVIKRMIFLSSTVAIYIINV